MKMLLVVAGLFMPVSLSAEIIPSSDKDAMVHVARVVEVISLVEKPHVRVSLAVVDYGGSTDVSPTQGLYFTAYAKGEMYSTDLSFKLGPIFRYISSTRLSAGQYRVEVEAPGKSGVPTPEEWVIDARKALVDLKNVSCGNEFDCKASREFSAKISLEKKPVDKP